MGLTRVDLLASFHTTQCQYYYALETPLPLGVLGLNAFDHPCTFQVRCVSFSHINSSRSVQVSSRTCQRSTQTFNSSGTILDVGLLASHCCQHFGRYSFAVSHHKRYNHGCFGGPCAQGSAISTFNPFAPQRYVFVQTGVLFSVFQAVAGAT